MPKRIIYKRMTAAVLLLFFAAGFIIPAPLLPPAQAAGFSDISGHWAGNDILQLASLSVVKGSAGRFNPGGAVTRAEFAAMIIAALGYADQAKIARGMATGYFDVPGYHWASGFVTLAKEKGIITGYPDGTFQPAKVIRRDEITSVLVRALNLPAGPEDMLQNFIDAGDISGWARPSISTAYTAGLVSGFPDGSFKPGRFASRGETAAMIKKVLAELGRQYTLYAAVEQVPAGGGSLTLNVAGQITTAVLAGGATVLAGGRLVGPDALKAGDYVFVILDDNGIITYIELADATYAGIGGFTGNEKAVSAAGAGAPERGAPAVEAPGHMGGALADEAPEPGEDRTVLVATAPGKVEEVAGFVENSGGHVMFTAPEVDFLTAEVEEDTYDKLRRHRQVLEVTENRPVAVTRPRAAETLETARPQAPQNVGAAGKGSPGRSLDTTKGVTGVNDFVNATGADGAGQVIAVIDTGIDPGHPDLQQTAGGKQKISAWVDFTGEGDIETATEVTAVDGVLHLLNGDYRIGGIRSASGRFRYGYLQEKSFYNETGDVIDVNFNGTTNDIFAVLVVDSNKAGQYDRVYLDTDGDRDFSDEKELGAYSVKPDYTGFRSADGRNEFNLVVTRIESTGREINIGFDGNDHGTHVAGIAAASGTVRGMAPGAQVMALKVLNSAGMGDPATISRAVTYAAMNGATVINMSLGFKNEDGDAAVMEKLITGLSAKYGVLFITAAGNDGPGLRTAAGLGETGSALSVGAFSSPEMWRVDYGWDVPENNLWYFSSIGPRSDGSPAISVVAPGSVVSTVPLRRGERYFLSEGTSMAAPHVAGAAALLLDAASGSGLPVSPGQLKKALERGARPISGYSAVEQGFGVVNTMVSWHMLRLLPEDITGVGARNYDLANRNGAGIFAREYLPGRMTFYLSDRAGRPRQLALAGTASWLRPEQGVLNIPASGVRGLDVDMRLPDEPGLYSAYLSGTDLATTRPEMNVLATVVKPYMLEPGNNHRVTVEDTLGPARYKRYFFRVASGADKLNIRLSVPGGAGRVRMLLYGPGNSRELGRNLNFAGVNPDGTVAAVEVSADFPAAGTWELVVYSSASLSAYNLRQSAFSLEAALAGVKPVQLPQKTRDILVGVLPKKLVAGKKTYLTVQVRDRYTLRPFEGLLEINGITYFTRHGRVLLPVETQDSAYSLQVKTIPAPASAVPLEYRFNLPAGN